MVVCLLGDHRGTFRKLLPNIIAHRVIPRSLVWPNEVKGENLPENKARN